jgi:hypothetical protein
VYNDKEATSNEITLHDDDPELLEFILKFMYTVRYDSEALKKSKTPVQMALTPIEIWVIADKYDIPHLEEPVTQDLDKILTAVAEPKHQALIAVIEAYYPICSLANSSIGKVIASQVLNKYRNFTLSVAFTKALEQYPLFAADFALQYNREGLFRFKNVSCSCNASFAVKVTGVNGDNFTMVAYGRCFECGITSHFKPTHRV